MAHPPGERDKPATKINGKFYPLQHQEWVQACKTLTKSQLSVLLYLRTLDPYSNGIRVRSSKIAADLGITKRSVNSAITRLVEEGSIDPTAYGLELNDPNDTESQIRDSLKSQLGGLTEVKTPAGRIDLLTETEIIEVKRVGEWKSGLGQILVYSGFYPEHRKRLHLFGSESEEQKIVTIANSCLAFDVLVSFEVVVGVKP